MALGNHTDEKNKCTQHTGYAEYTTIRYTAEGLTKEYTEILQNNQK